MPSKITIQELDDLYSAAVELKGAEREAFLVRSCSGRPDLRQQLDKMLATGDGFLAESLMTRSLRRESEVKQVGRWRLGEQAGEGGLGVVYRAWTEEDGIRVEAAVKVLRPGFDGGAFHERFQRERQILATLDHPGIARLMDCGVDARGRSFLAMEYVDGRELDRYLSEVKPGRKQRVELIEGLARATEYLHSKLVVHGDIKPSNVMVTASGATKLLDFGAARLLSSPESSGLTRMMLTPHYASPEQKAGGGPSVAGDIYSLGKLMVEVLGDDHGDDLRAIIARCIAEQPAGRYGSAAGLAEDLARWRAGYPVHARRLTAWYAAERFLRRNSLAAALTGLLFGAIGVNWWNARESARVANALVAETNRQRVLAAENAVRAEENAARAAAAAVESERRREQAEAARKAADEVSAVYRELLGTMSAVDAEFDGAYLSIPDASAMQKQQTLIQHLERAGAPQAELAGAWRRFADVATLRGDFRHGIAAFEKAAAYAERWKRTSGSPQSRAFEISVHLNAGVRLLTRGDAAGVKHWMDKALALTAALPPSERQVVARGRAFTEAKIVSAGGRLPMSGAYGEDPVSAAAAVRAPTPEDIAALQRALETTRRDTAGVAARGRILDRLITAMKQQSAKPEELRPYCAEAERLLMFAACAPAPEFPLRAAGVAGAFVIAGELPDVQAVRLRLVETLLGHARQLSVTGRKRESIFTLDITDKVLAECAAADPDGPRVKRLLSLAAIGRRQVESRQGRRSGQSSTSADVKNLP